MKKTAAEKYKRIDEILDECLVKMVSEKLIDKEELEMAQISLSTAGIDRFYSRCVHGKFGPWTVLYGSKTEEEVTAGGAA